MNEFNWHCHSVIHTHKLFGFQYYWSSWGLWYVEMLVEFGTRQLGPLWALSLTSWVILVKWLCFSEYQCPHLQRVGLIISASEGWEQGVQSKTRFQSCARGSREEVALVWELGIVLAFLFSPGSVPASFMICFNSHTSPVSYHDLHIYNDPQIPRQPNHNSKWLT